MTRIGAVSDLSVSRKQVTFFRCRSLRNAAVRDSSSPNDAAGKKAAPRVGFDVELMTVPHDEGEGVLDDKGAGFARFFPYLALRIIE